MRPSLTACLAFCIGFCIAFPTALQFLQIGPKGQVIVSPDKHEAYKQVESKSWSKPHGHRHHEHDRPPASTPTPTPPPMPTPTPTPTPTPKNESQVVTEPDLGLIRKAEPLLLPELATDTKPVPGPSPVLPAPLNTPTPTPTPKATPTLPPPNPPAHEEGHVKNQHLGNGNNGGDPQSDTQKYLHLTIENGGSENFWPVAIQLNVNGKNGLSLRDNVKDHEMFGTEKALTPGSSTIFKIPYGVMQVQVIPRKNCGLVDGHFKCEYGDCGNVQCKDGFVFTRNLVTRFEVGWCDQTNKFVAGSVAYDISNIDVHDLGRVGVLVKSPNDKCQEKYCPRGGCGTQAAWNLASDENLGSPADTVCQTESLIVRFD